MKSATEVGFEWFVRVVRKDGTIEREGMHNLMPIEGRKHMMATEYKGGAQVTQWYIALFEGNYTPVDSLTANDFPTAAVEFMAYPGSTRKEFVTGPINSGSVDNFENKAEFVFTEDKTVYGGVITSSSVKGSVNGVLSSAVRFPSPKTMQAGDKLEVIAANTITSVA